MSESDSNPSSGISTGTDSPPINTAPYLKKKTDSTKENTHGYFIPAIMATVLGVIIVATFYSKEFNNLIADIVPFNQGDSLATDTNDKFVVQSNSIHNSEDGAETNDGTTSVAESGVAATTSTVTETSGAEKAAENAISAGTVASNRHLAAYPARQDGYFIPYAPPLPYAIPGEYWSAYNELMEERRRVHEEAVQARREHMKKIHEYRLAVMKRIEQDRANMFKHMQELAQESQRRRDALINRMEQTEKQSMNRPI